MPRAIEITQTPADTWYSIRRNTLHDWHLSDSHPVENKNAQSSPWDFSLALCCGDNVAFCWKSVFLINSTVVCSVVVPHCSSGWSHAENQTPSGCYRLSHCNIPLYHYDYCLWLSLWELTCIGQKMCYFCHARGKNRQWRNGLETLASCCIPTVVPHTYTTILFSDCFIYDSLMSTVGKLSVVQVCKKNC